MQRPDLLHLTCSEPLTLDEEFENQKEWQVDPNKLTFIVLDRRFPNLSVVEDNQLGSMAGDVNVFIGGVLESGEAEIDVMIVRLG